jgi:hypothetical protein
MQIQMQAFSKRKLSLCSANHCDLLLSSSFVVYVGHNFKREDPNRTSQMYAENHR